MALPRVIVVDDDPSIRRLVALALEDLAIDLQLCAGAAEAVQALQAGPARLLITDLMMPGITGFDLLQQLADDPALRGGARLAVFSAGLNAQAQARLAGLPVWRQIDKPVSVLALANLVEQAVADDGPAPADEPSAPADAPADGTAAAIAQHFGGQAALFHAFRASCVQQLPLDLLQADTALVVRDAGTVRRMGHSLKSVLQLLGEPAASTDARALEQAAAEADWPACDAAWQRLRAALQRLAPAG